MLLHVQILAVDWPCTVSYACVLSYDLKAGRSLCASLYNWSIAKQNSATGLKQVCVFHVNLLAGFI